MQLFTLTGFKRKIHKRANILRQHFHNFFVLFKATTCISCGDTMLFKPTTTTSSTTITKMKCPKQQLQFIHMHKWICLWGFFLTFYSRLYSYDSKNNKMKNNNLLSLPTPYPSTISPFMLKKNSHFKHLAINTL